MRREEPHIRANIYEDVTQVGMSSEELGILSAVRNRVDHADKPMVECYGDVKKFAQARCLCSKHLFDISGR